MACSAHMTRIMLYIFSHAAALYIANILADAVALETL